jgi:hypothetical protein
LTVARPHLSRYCRTRVMAPRIELSIRVLLVAAISCEPLRILTAALSNAAVAHAARVQASPGPIITEDPDSMNDPLQVLQSTRADTRDASNVTS